MPVVVAALSGCGEGASSGEGESAASASQTLLRSIQQARLVSSAPNSFGYFGSATAIDGNTIAVAERVAKSDSGSGESKGAVYLFEHNGATWTEIEALKAPGTTKDNFGASIALEGDLLAVGAPYSSPASGAVFTYVHNNGTWALETKLVAEDGLGSEDFGSQVSLSGNTLIVRDVPSGAFGAAYIFVRNGGVWSQQARIASEKNSIMFVAVSNDTAIIADTDRTQVFVRSGNTWNQEAEFDPGLPYWDVDSMAFEGDTLIFGALERCRIFERTAGVWSQASDFWPGQMVAYEHLGTSLALDGGRALVSAVSPLYNFQSDGFVYSFREAGGVWAEEARATADDLPPNIRFGDSVALSGDTLLVGAPEESVPSSYAGAAYVLMLVPGLENGVACARAADCASGFCTDGVCCDTICAGTCMACSSAKKGSGTEGICEPIENGTDPDAECGQGPTAYCVAGACSNRADMCEKSPAGTACDDGNACTEGDVCSDGTCGGNALVCAPPDACHLEGQCNAATGRCEYALINPTDPACSPQSCSCAAAGNGAGGDTYAWGLVALALVRKRLTTLPGNRKERRKV